MTARAFYLVVVAPFFAWLIIDPLLSSWLAWMADSGQTANLVERVVILGFVWAKRMAMPAAVVGLVIATPLLPIVATWLLGRNSANPARGVSSMLVWLGLFVSSCVAGMGIAHWVPLSFGFLVFSICSAAAAQAIVIAIAYRTQQSLNAEGLSAIPARDVLWLGIVLQLLFAWPGFLAAAIPLVASMRARKTRTA